MEWLREVVLNLTSTLNNELIFRSQFVHTQNRNNVAKFLIALQSLLNAASNRVVLKTDDVRVNLAGGRVERVNGRIDTKSSDITRKHHCSIQVTKGRGRRRVSQVVSRDIHSLHRGNGTCLRGSDTFLKLAHFFSQCRLITHRRRHTAEQSGNFSTGEGVTIDVVDKEQNVATFITESFCHRQASQCNAQTVSRGFVHLTEHHGDLVENFGLSHFVVEVITLTRTFTDAGKHGVATVLLSNIINELHHVDGFAHTGATKQADLTTLSERADKINHLDAGFEKIDGR